MKRINHIIAAIALSAATYITAGAADNNTAEGKERGYMTINRQTAEAHIGFLASDELQGREAGYPSGRIAANYAEACLRATGLEPWDGKTSRQPLAAYRRARPKYGVFPITPSS
ncbi:MAG: aminopeptidase, partial [Paramuribaculum intestinale]